jgi:hypothetical protein
MILNAELLRKSAVVYDHLPAALKVPLAKKITTKEIIYRARARGNPKDERIFTIDENGKQIWW